MTHTAESNTSLGFDVPTLLDSSSTSRQGKGEEDFFFVRGETGNVDLGVRKNIPLTPHSPKPWPCATDGRHTLSTLLLTARLVFVSGSITWNVKCFAVVQKSKDNLLQQKTRVIKHLKIKKIRLMSRYLRFKRFLT